MKLLYTLVCVLLAWEKSVEAKVDCDFTIPSSAGDGCTLYDLSAVAAQGAFTTSDGNFNYTFGFCQDVKAPVECTAQGANMAAFQYNNNGTCYGVGSNSENSTYLVSHFWVQNTRK